MRRQGEAEPVKSVGNGLTFRRDLVGAEDIRVGLGYLTEEVAARLRRAGLRATAVGVNIKDPALHSISRQKQLPDATDLARELAEAVISLVLANWDPRRPIRALTVTAFGLTDQPTARQTSLFDDPTEQSRREKRERLEQTLDGLRERFGTEAVLAGGVLGSDLGLARNKAAPRKNPTPDRGGDIASAAGGEKEKIKW